MQKKVKVEISDVEGGRANGAGAAGGSSMDGQGGAVSVKKEPGDVGMVFTSTTEFTSRLEVGVTWDLFLSRFVFLF